MVNIRTKDVTTKSVGALETPNSIKVRNNNNSKKQPIDLKAQLKDIGVQKKQLNSQLKDLKKQETQIKKQINKSKTKKTTKK